MGVSKRSRKAPDKESRETKEHLIADQLEARLPTTLVCTLLHTFPSGSNRQVAAVDDHHPSGPAENEMQQLAEVLPESRSIWMG